MSASGLRALGTEEARLVRILDGIFEGWGVDAGAESVMTPVLLPVADLARLDFYENFPQQAMLAAPLDLAKRDGKPTTDLESFDPSVLEPAVFGLPSAACFAVYIGMRGERLAGNVRVTVLGNCFRREEKYEDLRRLLAFRMREVVALGAKEYVDTHLAEFEERIAAFLSALGLSFEKQAATDPFYDRGGQRALLQKLSPVKQEFVVGDLAIASLNIHRNFFGERCDIRSADSGAPVFSGCAAFGLERWMSVLHGRFGDWASATTAVEKAAMATFGKD